MKNFLIELNSSIRDSLLQLEKNTEKCLVVVDSNNILKGTLTDGDIRRAMLRGSDINSKISKYMKKKPFYFKSKNFTKSSDDVNKIIKDKHIDVIPLVDSNHKVVEIILNKNFIKYLENDKILKILMKQKFLQEK